MSRINVGRFSQLLRRFLEQKGTEVVASELSPEISPVFILENDRPDWLFLKGERLCVASFATTSGASLGPTVRVRNPLASAALATIVGFSINPNTNTSFASARLTISNNNLAGGNVPLFIRDGRELVSLGINKSAMVGSFSNTIEPVGDLMWTTNCIPNEERGLNQPFILSPGRAFDVGLSSVSVNTVHINIYWTERALPAIEA